MLRAVTFDFWGTLYGNAFAREERLDLLSEALARAGQPRSRSLLESAYEHSWRIFDRLWLDEHRPMGAAVWLQTMLGLVDAQLPEEIQGELVRALEEVLLSRGLPHPVAGAPETVTRLARRYRLGVVSDVGLTPGRVLREILRRDGLLPLFRALAFSDECGCTKPEPAIFRSALEGLAVEPSEAAHVGDLPETDLQGARALGMRAVLFLGVSRRLDGCGLADAVFERYEELEEILQQLDRQTQETDGSKEAG
ncbi:MAG: HAD family hydrolase [Chloroflexia bacterium]